MSTACEACGWAAAFCSMLAFGTFGVPIKSRAAVQVDVDPLVFQSYKTGMCFLTSWIVLLMGERFTFSPWGIVSGLFWVPGGVATIYAVKAAGLAIGIGIGSSFIVLVSFVWGIFIFDERVHSRFGACLAIFCMMLGLIGMSYFSSPQVGDNTAASVVTTTITTTNHPSLSPDGGATATATNTTTRKGIAYEEVNSVEDPEDDGLHDLEESRGALTTGLGNKFTISERTQRNSYTDDASASDDLAERDEPDDSLDVQSLSSVTHVHEPHHVLCGIKFTHRQVGMLAAMFCGVWGGSIMAPMKWCKSNTQGVAYLLSFSIGASIVTLSLWFFRYLYNVYKYQSVTVAYKSLPSFHIRKLWFAGGCCGLLWSIGNFFSLLSVYYLGEGVGYPLVQTSILVSGLWGIFYFKEVTGTERITKWLLSSMLTIFGILLLSYEHHEK